MKKLLLISSIIILMIACKKSDQKENQIIEFLNNKEENFNKSKYELVGLKLIDSIYVTDYHIFKMNSNFEKYDPNQLIYVDADTTVTNDFDYYADTDTTTIPYFDNFKFNDIDWLSQPLSRKLHELIKEDNGRYLLENSPNEFLNKIVRSSYQKFKYSLMNDSKFDEKLFFNISLYDKFNTISNQDSLKKYLNIERKKEKEIYGFIYGIKFRVSDKLYEREFIFDKFNKLIEFKKY